VVKWCVLEQKLLLIAYTNFVEESIGTKMNDLYRLLKNFDDMFSRLGTIIEGNE